MANDPINAYLLGLLALFGGMIMVHYHNIWDDPWRVLISLWSWGCLLGGAILLIFPDYYSYFGEFISVDMILFFGVISIPLGLLFGYYGFINKSESNTIE